MGVSAKLVAFGAGIVYLVLERIRVSVNTSAWEVSREAAFYFFSNKTEIGIFAIKSILKDNGCSTPSSRCNTGKLELTRADRRVISLPVTVLEALSSKGPVILTSEPNYVPVVAIIRYLRQILAHINITFEGHHRQRATATKRAG